MNHWTPLATIALLASLVTCSYANAAKANVLVSAKVSKPPIIDGVQDKIWRKAMPLYVTVRKALGGSNPQTVEVRSVHTDSDIFFLFKWSDATPSTMRDPYIWNQTTKSYDRPTKPDDQFAIEFPISGDFDISMLTTKHAYKADVWHWKAGRGGPIGWVDNKHHVIGLESTDPKAVPYPFHGKTVYVLRALDRGQPAYKVKDKPTTYGGDIVDSFLQQQPTEQLACIRGMGKNDGAGWTLEMGRKLDTGDHSDDAVISQTGDTVFAIAMLNDELFEEHSVSEKLILRLAK